jgi:hypothetical protein
MRHWNVTRARPAALRQQLLPFRRRSERRERAFKAAILAATALAVATTLGGSATGRYAVHTALTQARRWALRPLGIEPSREEVENDLHRQRLLRIDHTRAALARTIAEGGPRVERFLKAARMDPDTAVIRWGNFDESLVLSSAVFEPDDSGRSYRLRPNTRSVWFIGISLGRVSGMFEVPCTREAREAGEAVGGRLVPGSLQTTNSWGCRGPEPDPDAPLRVLVLGDSIMQGLLVGDDETPSECLRRELRDWSGGPVSVLNTGVLGYSVEQYYYTLLAFGDRFRPHFVVVSICGNDFGDWDDPAHWDEGQYWLREITDYCRTRGLPFLFVPWPGDLSLLGIRDATVYPGMVSRIAKVGGMHYLDPVETFADEDLRLRIEAGRRGHFPNTSPQYNRHLLGDAHLSPAGCATWAKAVARRLSLILEWEAVRRSRPETPDGPVAGRKKEVRSRDPGFSVGLPTAGGSRLGPADARSTAAGPRPRAD